MSAVTEISRRYSEQFASDVDNSFSLADFLNTNDRKPSDDLFVSGANDDAPLDFLLQMCDITCDKSPNVKSFVLDNTSTPDTASFALQDLLAVDKDSLQHGGETPKKQDFTLADLYYGNEPATSCETFSLSQFLAPNLADVTEGIGNPPSCDNNLRLVDFLLKDSYEEQTTEVNDTHTSNINDSAEDSTCSLADLYLSSKCQADSFSDRSSLSDDKQLCTSPSDLQNQVTAQFDSSPESGYSSEKDKPAEDFIDLSQAKSGNISLQCINSHQWVPIGITDTNRKSKPSLLFKTLCSEPKPNDLSSVPKLPSNMEEILEKMDYWRYFSFDTPSPDDIVKEMQKNACGST